MAMESNNENILNLNFTEISKGISIELDRMGRMISEFHMSGKMSNKISEDENYSVLTTKS